ncbi:DNA mismatch repair protein MutT [Hoeflea marina]|nr:DNA mismatch repair protein MutT [Hoeflea marina]
MAMFAEDSFVPLDHVTLRLAEGPHPWQLAERDAVEALWARERVERPFLYNGTVIMHRGLAMQGGGITGISHAVPYAVLLHWLEAQPAEADIWHLFGSPVIVSSDQALVLIRMAQRTAGAGRIVSPGGSLDLADIRDGVCDVEGNMAREMAEETGLDLAHARAEPQLTGWRRGHRVTVFRRYHFDRTAAEIAAAIEAHIASEAEPEADAAVVFRNAGQITGAVPAHMRAMIRFQFR